MNKNDDFIIKFQYGGMNKDLDCEPEESEMFGILCSMYEALGRNPEALDFERYSSNYVTVKLGEWDVARMHWGPRSKWVMFPTVEISSTKHKVTAPEDVRQFKDLLEESVEFIEKYSS